jgi:riboflavin kinase/FMN adenylyltransferase
VREAVQAGDVQRASDVLARPFTLSAQVVHGDARGRDLGYPTANLRFPATQLVPGIGIYAGAALVGTTWWPAAISVGTRPQFYDNGDVLVEVHIPGFVGNLYDSQLRVAFLTFLRGEATFGDVDALIAQIKRDVDESVEIFQKFSPNDVALLG